MRRKGRGIITLVWLRKSHTEHTKDANQIKCDDVGREVIGYYRSRSETTAAAAATAAAAEAEQLELLRCSMGKMGIYRKMMGNIIVFIVFKHSAAWMMGANL